MVFGLAMRMMFSQHQSRVGQQRPPRFGDGFDVGQNISGRQTPQPPHEVERLGGRDRIAVHHAQRIMALDDMNARQRAPRAADRVEIAPGSRCQLRHAVERGFDDALGALGRFVRGVLQRQRAERQRHAGADRVAP